MYNPLKKVITHNGLSKLCGQFQRVIFSSDQSEITKQSEKRTKEVSLVNLFIFLSKLDF